MIIAFRLKFMNLFFISYVFSVVMRVCVTYVGMRFFFISADSYLVTLLSLAVTFPLSLCSDAGSAGDSPLPHRLPPAVPVPFVGSSLMPSVRVICVPVLFPFVFMAAQGQRWPFTCLIFILDACTNHRSLHFWILYTSSRFSFVLLGRYLSFGQLWKAFSWRLSLLAFSNVHMAGCQLHCCKSLLDFSILELYKFHYQWHTSGLVVRSWCC